MIDLTPNSFELVPFSAKVSMTDLADGNPDFISQNPLGGFTHAPINSDLLIRLINDTGASAGASYVNFMLEGNLTEITVKLGRFALAVPAGLNGKKLTAALATIHTLGTSGTTTIRVMRRRGGSSANMFSTDISIPYNEYYAANGAINTSNNEILTGDKVYVNVPTVAAGSPKGLSVVLTFS